MSETPPPPPPPGGWTLPSDGPGSQERAPRSWRTWQLALVAVVALLLGVALGGPGGGDAEQAGAPADGDAADELREQVSRLEAEIDDRDELLAAAEADLADAQAETAASDPEPETDAEPEPTADDGVHRSGDYTFTDVQVTADFADDFQVRTRATNEGGARTGVVVSATLFADGSVVGTAQGSVQDWAAGQTVTLELISLDDHTEWDAVEFQIDSQF